MGSLATAIQGGRNLASRSRYHAIVLITLVVALSIRLVNLGQPLLERHAFRQTQTAYPALLFHEHGINLLHPLLPVLGPPFEVPLEFPLFQALGSLVMDLGVPPDPAMRLTGTLCFFATALLLWGLVGRLAGQGAALAALLFFLFSPHGIAWGRTSMIEYLATAGAIGYVWAGVVWREERRPILWAVAILAGSVAMLVKITTGLFYVLPLLAYAETRESGGFGNWVRRRCDPALVVMVALPLAAAVLWTRHADAIKAAHEATAWFTSANIKVWNFGTLAQRLDPSAWLKIGARLALYVVGLPFLAVLPFSAAAAFRSRQPIFWAAMALAAFLPIATFFNLYWVHDYYLAAVSPAIATILGIGAARLWKRCHGRYGAASLIAACLVSAIVVGLTTTRYLRPTFESTGPDPLAREVAAASRPDDLVIVTGAEWSSHVLYYARRRGLMLPTVLLDSRLLQRLPEEGYRVLASADPDRDPLWVLREWPWVGALGPRTYALGNAPADLREAPVAATDDLSGFEAASRSGRRLLAGPIRIACSDGVSSSVPAGEGGTWLRFADGTPKDARVRVADGWGAMPARQVVFLTPAVSPMGAALHVTCSGADSLTLLDAVEGPPPGDDSRVCGNNS